MKTFHRMTRKEISLFRNSLKHNICVELLQDGYHRSFRELFSVLASEQRRLAAAAEQDSAVWLQPRLEEQPDKMEAMRQHLRRAEQAENISSWTSVCRQRLLLGQFFSSPQDSSLALHFLLSCAEAEKERGGASGPATEARVCLGEVYLQRGELQRARQQVELCIQQADVCGWLDSNRRPLRLRARGVLWRICSRQADEPLKAGDLKGALQLLHEGHRAANGSEDKTLQSEACYRLGLTYQSTGDHGRAQQFFKCCLEMCTALQDADGMGKCYKAIASQGKNTHDKLQCLEMMAAIYRSSGSQLHQADALLCLGNIYFKMSEYDRACEYFLQSYKLSCELEDLSLLEKAQVSLASARALSLIGEHRADLEASSNVGLRCLVIQKEARREAWRETLRKTRGLSPGTSDGPEAHG
ncbi:tetratricopeptide repeat protein 29 [Clinocottus analis]|uniref:tetratricopeptide repeat protein 29 n=1 Tax=Clinocottus analis TaxID=304258 RepID=UPI0035BF71B9